MNHRSSSRRRTRESPQQSVGARLPFREIGIIGGVVILIGAVLFLKARRSPDTSAKSIPADPVGPAEQVQATSSGAGVPAAGTAEAANVTASSPTPNLLPEAQLDRLLQAGEPVFLFFHSNTCVQCVKMTGIVEEIYPEFSDSVALVDVDVYDEQNRNLLQRANIRAIPTLIFVDAEGEVTGHVGVMESDALREQLRQMGEE